MAGLDELKKEVKKAFDIFDTDGDGLLDAEEIVKMFKYLGVDKSTLNISSLVDNENQISVEDLYTIITAKLNHTIDNLSQKEILFAFSLFDFERNGNISNKQLERFLTNLDEKLSADDISFLIKQFDIQGKGEVQYEEMYDRIMLQMEKAKKL